MLIGIIVFVPIGAVVGAIGGAIEAVPEGVAQEIETQIVEALSNPRMQTLLRDRVLEVLRNETRYSAAILDAAGPKSQTDTSDYQHLSDQDIDVVLEIGVLMVGLTGIGGADPDLSMFMNARARLISTFDNAELYEHTVSFLGMSRKFTEWGAEEGRAIEVQLDRAYQHLAEQP